MVSFCAVHIEDHISPSKMKESYAQFNAGEFAPDNIEISHQPVVSGYVNNLPVKILFSIPMYSIWGILWRHVLMKFRPSQEGFHYKRIEAIELTVYHHNFSRGSNILIDHIVY